MLGDQGGAVALITKDGTQTRYFGDHDEHTGFEIGSVSKTMVGYLLADAFVREGLAEDAPVHTLWSAAPEGIPVVSLATHTSGVPRLPADLFEGANPYDPYAHYTVERMNTALHDLQLGAPEYEYSNFGFGLLGEILAALSKGSFAEVMTSKVFQPAGMQGSYVAVTGDDTDAQLAQGYDVLGEPATAWRFQALAGAGAVVSTLNDMVNYVRFMQAGLLNKDPVVANMLAVRGSLGDCCDQALAWIISEDEQGNAYAWHNGQTGGFSSFVGFYLDGSRAVVVLNNQSYTVNEPALALLTGTKTLADLP